MLGRIRKLFDVLPSIRIIYKKKVMQPLQRAPKLQSPPLPKRDNFRVTNRPMKHVLNCENSSVWRKATHAQGGNMQSPHRKNQTRIQSRTSLLRSNSAYHYTTMKPLFLTIYKLFFFFFLCLNSFLQSGSEFVRWKYVMVNHTHWTTFITFNGI